MKLTRQRLILMSVLGIGGLALLVDRVVLDDGATNPRHATADDAAERFAVPQDAADAGMLPNVTTSADADGPLLSRRLAETAEAHAVSPLQPRDAFTPPTTWVAPAHEPAPPTDAGGDVHDDMDASRERFVRMHQLKAVMNDRGAGVAIVNDRALRVGDQLNGWTLVRVGDRGVSFESAGRRVGLVVSDGR